MIDIKFRRPPPGASAEERAAAYADALLITENALTYFQDELSKHTEQLLVTEINAKSDRQQADDRFEHIEMMLQAIMRVLQLDPATGLPSGIPTVPAMRDKMVTADEIADAVEKGVEKGVESAIERKTPATAFAIPQFNPWQAPPVPVGITSERAKEIVENRSNKDEKDKLVEREKARGDMYRGIVIGAVGFLGGAGLLGLVYLIAKAIVGAH